MSKVLFIDYGLNHQNSTVRNYISLLKPRVMSLVVFSALCALIIAPGKIHPFIAFVAILATATGAGAAGCLNMWYDADIDSIMTRTAKRPIVTGKIQPEEALLFGVILSIFSIIVMAVCVNMLSAFLLLSSILFYFFIYTVWLKRTTVQNIVIGGASGAFPPLIGWAAVTNDLSFEPILLFLIIFFWTPPHFWALALYKSSDYKKAKIPMMPVVKGDLFTKQQMVVYTFLTNIFSLALYFVDYLGYIYFISAIILNSIFLYLVVNLSFDVKNKLAPKVFGYSIFYLFSLFASMVVDKIIL